MIQKITQFICIVLTPKADTPSFGRFMSLVITVFVLGWDTAYIMFAWRMNHHLPAGMQPLDLLPSGGTLAAQIAFMTAFYGVTRSGDVLTSRKANGIAQPPPAAPPQG